ncbi:4-alpha-glucanotransferase [Scytonema hofmannii PCC 7110]|uniref:4-alpha-glucanotransferase n=1 Tax=Scytonema hofmannii PCC 7110 TaxID=128403 RepID=A0A139XHK3_9CYAN|nr:4-alpha-glucanotransferase [Scytonema hofmannii]KYC44176.1 4-alpha-glucanotransferase [Scytonema hofmannii PCC 7110]
MPFPRSSGILLHPTSFPGRFGIGDLGLEAYQFIDFLRDSCQQFWQVLPLGPTGYGNSPYACYSALAGNPFLVSLEKMVEQGLLVEEDFAHLPGFERSKVDYEKVIPIKLELLRKACENFKNRATPLQQTEFAGFCDSKAYWLDDYALFMALKGANGGVSWHKWEPELAKRVPSALDRAGRELTGEIFFHKFTQYEFFRQWSELKTYANMSGVQIIGDIPIYVAHDSADVWSHPDIFCLDEETGEAALMAGVPPDYFSETGQLWGNPVYNWEELKKQDYNWWVGRFQALLDYVDVIRIDHFRGFEAYWAVPQGEETAINGEWLKAPGEELFEAIKLRLGKLPIMAEDLGLITPEVEALRDKYEFPGMKILQFAFGSDAGNPFLPFNYSRNFIVYTGTHDNDTTISWFNQATEYEKQYVLNYLGCLSPEGIHWDFIRLAMNSVANQAIIPLQDVLGLGGEARMNFPSKAEGNWDWRCTSGSLTKEVSQRLQTLTRLSGRSPQGKS